MLLESIALLYVLKTTTRFIHLHWFSMKLPSTTTTTKMLRKHQLYIFINSILSSASSSYFYLLSGSTTDNFHRLS